jgi:hypothetical protein
MAKKILPYKVGDLIFVHQITKGEDNKAFYIPEMNAFFRKSGVIAEMAEGSPGLLVAGTDDLVFFDPRDVRRLRHAPPVVEYVAVADVAPAPVKPAPAKKEKAALSLRDELLAKGDAGLCSWGIEFTSGKRNFYLEQACHAKIAHTDYYGAIPALLCLSLKGYEQLGEPYRKYLNYIINESPWRSIFHSFGVNDALNNGLMVNIDKPAYQVLAACIALREGNEFSGKLKLFSELLVAGYSGHTAFIISNAIVGKLDAPRNTGISNWHHVLAEDLDAEELFRFMNNGYADKKEESFREKSQCALLVAGKLARRTAKGNIKQYITDNSGYKVVYDGWGTPKMDTKMTRAHVTAVADAMDNSLKG